MKDAPSLELKFGSAKQRLEFMKENDLLTQLPKVSQRSIEENDPLDTEKFFQS